MFLTQSLPGYPRSEHELVASMWVTTEAPQPERYEQGRQLFVAAVGWFEGAGLYSGISPIEARRRAIRELEALLTIHAHFWDQEGHAWSPPTEIVVRQAWRDDLVFAVDVEEISINQHHGA